MFANLEHRAQLWGNLLSFSRNEDDAMNHEGKDATAEMTSSEKVRSCRQMRPFVLLLSSFSLRKKFCPELGDLIEDLSNVSVNPNIWNIVRFISIFYFNINDNKKGQ